MKNKKAFIITGSVILICIIALVAVFTNTGSVATQVSKQLDLGHKYLLEGNYKEAIIAFEKAIQIDPKSVDARLGLSEVYVAANRIEDAIIVLNDAMVIDLNRPEPYTNLARIFMLQGDYQKALEILEKGLKNSGDTSIVALLDELKPQTPVASVESGKYTEPVTVKFDGIGEKDEVYYTLNGSEPNKEAIKYDKPIKFGNGKNTIRAITYRNSVIASDEARYEYEIDIPWKDRYNPIESDIFSDVESHKTQNDITDKTPTNPAPSVVAIEPEPTVSPTPEIEDWDQGTIIQDLVDTPISEPSYKEEKKWPIDNIEEEIIDLDDSINKYNWASIFEESGLEVGDIESLKEVNEEKFKTLSKKYGIEINGAILEDFLVNQLNTMKERVTNQILNNPDSLETDILLRTIEYNKPGHDEFYNTVFGSDVPEGYSYLQWRDIVAYWIFTNDFNYMGEEQIAYENFYNFVMKDNLYLEEVKDIKFISIFDREDSNYYYNGYKLKFDANIVINGELAFPEFAVENGELILIDIYI